APLCTFREIERQIAGLHDEAALAPDAISSGVPTDIGVKLAVERGDTAPSYSIDTSPPAARPATSKPNTNKSGAKQQPTSEHDAPLETAKSDDAHTGEDAK